MNRFQVPFLISLGLLLRLALAAISVGGDMADATIDWLDHG